MFWYLSLPHIANTFSYSVVSFTTVHVWRHTDKRCNWFKINDCLQNQFTKIRVKVAMSSLRFWRGKQYFGNHHNSFIMFAKTNAGWNLLWLAMLYNIVYVFSGTVHQIWCNVTSKHAYTTVWLLHHTNPSVMYAHINRRFLWS